MHHASPRIAPPELGLSEDFIALADAASEPWTLVRDDGAVLHHNVAAQGALGLGSDLHRDLDALVPPEDQRRVRRAIRLALGAKRRGSTRVRVAVGHGAWREAEVEVRPLPGAHVDAPTALVIWKMAPEADEELRELARRAFVPGLWGVDVATGRLAVCARWRALLDIPETEEMDHAAAWFDRIHPEDRPRVEVEFLDVTEGLAPRLDTEVRMKRNDGTYEWMRVRAVPRSDDDDNVMQLAGTQESIDAQKRVTEVLRESEARLLGLLSSLPDGVIVHRYGRVVWVNKRMAELLGDVPDQVIRRHLLQIVEGASRSSLAGQAREAMHSPGATPPTEVRLLRTDRAEAIAEITSQRIEYEGEAAVLSVVHDVQEQRSMRAKLAQASRMASLGTLAAGVAHEINNPLTYITLGLEGLLERVPHLSDQLADLEDALTKELGPERAQRLMIRFGPHPDACGDMLAAASDAHKGAMRVRDIVKDLRLFSRAEESKLVPVSLPEVLETALNLSAHEVKHRATIERDYEEVPAVLAQEGRLCQVFVNLLVNAAQACEGDDPTRNVIHVSVRTRAGEVVVAIRDTGRGIPGEHLPRIFDPFFTTKPPGEGTGLGLAMCHGFVESIEGHIEVDSWEGEGSEFRVVLPHRSEAMLDQEAEGQDFEPDEMTFVPSRLLLIDDDKMVCRSLSQVLRNDYEVVAVHSGRDAIELLKHDSGWDMVLCDLMMPDVTGMGVHAWIQENVPELLDHMVFVTGGAVTPTARAFVEEVPNVCLDKPLNGKNLRRLLRRLLNPPGRRVVDTPTPTYTPPEERRAGRRHPGPHLIALVGPDGGQRVEVVEYSLTGLRARSSTPAPPRLSAGDAVEIMLKNWRTGGNVRAMVALMRTEQTPFGTDLCFTFEDMDQQSIETYDQWLSTEA